MKQRFYLLLFFNLLFSSLFAAQSEPLALKDAHSYHSEENTSDERFSHVTTPLPEACYEQNIPTPLTLLKMTEEERAQLLLHHGADDIELFINQTDKELNKQFVSVSQAKKALAMAHKLMQTKQTPFRLLEQQVDEKIEELSKIQANLEELKRKKQIAQQEFVTFKQAAEEEHSSTQKIITQYNDLILLRKKMCEHVVQQAEKTDAIRHLASKLKTKEEENAALILTRQKQIETAGQWEKITINDIPQEPLSSTTSNNTSWGTSSGAWATSAGSALITGVSITFNILKNVVS